MPDIAELVKVMQKQMQLQQEQIQLQRQQMQKQDEQHKQQLVIMQQQMEDTRKARGTMAPQHQTPLFPAFDSTAELWKDYLLRFETFVNANSVPDEKKALVFLTNQTSGSDVARVTGARGQSYILRPPPSKIFFKMILKCI